MFTIAASILLTAPISFSECGPQIYANQFTISQPELICPRGKEPNRDLYDYYYELFKNNISGLNESIHNQYEVEYNNMYSTSFQAWNNYLDCLESSENEEVCLIEYQQNCAQIFNEYQIHLNTLWANAEHIYLLQLNALNIRLKNVCH